MLDAAPPESLRKSERQFLLMRQFELAAGSGAADFYSPGVRVRVGAPCLLVPMEEAG